MAKVMISLPDDLLARLDAHARRHGKTRSGLLREFAEGQLQADGESRRREIADILSRAADHGGRSVEYVRELRNAR